MSLEVEWSHDGTTRTGIADQVIVRDTAEDEVSTAVTQITCTSEGILDVFAGNGEHVGTMSQTWCELFERYAR